MQNKMRTFSHHDTRKYSIKFCVGFEVGKHTLQAERGTQSTANKSINNMWAAQYPAIKPYLNSQTLAAFGPAGVNHSAATAGCHANEETVCASALGL